MQIPGAPCRSRFSICRRAGAIALLLPLAVSQAFAAPVVVHATAGTRGADGTGSAVNGGAGGAAQTLTIVHGPNNDAANSLVLWGANGGQGGAGFDDIDNGVTGLGGSGGHGSLVSGAVFSFSGALAGMAVSQASGGHGGDAGSGMGVLLPNPGQPELGRGGNGGSASSRAAGVASGAAAVTVQASATGGNGGIGNGSWDGVSGSGGAALAQASGSSDSGNVSVTASASGGNGGDALGFFHVGGRGADVELNNAVTGSTRGALTLTQSASAGHGGRLGNPNPQLDQGDLTGATARSVLTLSDADASALTASVDASGGAGIDSSLPGTGGLGYSELTLTSTRAGTRVDGTLTATGGTGGNQPFVFMDSGGAGGVAQAAGSLRGLGDVNGRATATGGAAAPVAASGGDAVVQLAVVAGGLATGDVTAIGGAGSPPFSQITQRDGGAVATLELSGDGVQGSALARGHGASSSINAVNTGTTAANLTARAILAPNGAGAGGATVRLNVRGGSGVVSSLGEADGGDGYGFADVHSDLASAGAIDGVSRALGGYARAAQQPIYNGGAASSIRGEGSAAQAVNVSAIALANRANAAGDPALFGNASASAHGISASGVAKVHAEARGGIVAGQADQNAVDASATAVSRAAGGRATATALADGGYNSASARALGVGAGAGSAQVGFGASAVGGYGGYASASASNQYSEAGFALPLAGGTYTTAQTSAAPAAELPLGNNVAGSVGTLLGVGAHGAGNETGSEVFEYGPTVLQTSTGLFEFTALASQRLLIGFASSASLGGGFELLDLVILNNGVQLFAQSFTSLNAATQFFNGQVLDLGLLGAGAQQLSIASTFTFAPQSAFAFNYAVGTRVIASHAPEASTWVMMIAGLGGVLLMARRRREGAATSWPGDPRSASC